MTKQDFYNLLFVPCVERDETAIFHICSKLWPSLDSIDAAWISSLFERAERTRECVVSAIIDCDNIICQSYHYQGYFLYTCMFVDDTGNIISRRYTDANHYTDFLLLSNPEYTHTVKGEPDYEKFK